MSHDPLHQMISECQIGLSNLDPSDCDAREALIATCALTLSSIKDPQARISQANNYAILMAWNWDMPSSKALAVLEHHLPEVEP